MSDNLNLPPQDIAAEQAILGAIIQDQDNGAIQKAIAEGLTPFHFYRESHRWIFLGISELFEKNEPVDIVTVADYLRKTGDLERVGGVAYLSTLADSVPTAANVKYHTRIVKEKAELNSLIKISRNVYDSVYAGKSPDEILSDLRKKTENICSGRGGEIISMPDVTTDTFAFVERLYKSKDKISGVRTGFADVDSITNGWQPGDMIGLAGRPGTGKSAIAMNFAHHSEVPTAVVSLEMTKQQLGQRFLASLSQVEIMRLRTGRLNKEHWPMLTKAAGAMAELPIYFSFSTRNVIQLEQIITQMVERHGIKLLIVDYLQRVQNASAKTREREVAEVSSLLKTMALTHNIPVIALCQLNRAIENRNDKKPTLADLRDSGQIEQDCDIVIFLHRDNPQAPSGPVDLIFAKGRNIGLGKVTLQWDGDRMMFKDM